MRIVHLLQHVRQIGTGIVNVAVDLAVLQARDGHDVTVVSSGGEYEPLLRGEAIGVVTLAKRDGLKDLPSTAVAARRLLRDLSPDIVHAHMLTEAGLAWLCRPGLGYATVNTVHNEFQRGSLVMAVGDRVIAVSEAVKVSLLARRFPPGRLRTVRNGPIGSPRAAWARSGTQVQLPRPAIVTVVGLYDRKGVADLIAAFAIVAGTQSAASLTIVGDGPRRSHFENLARQSGYGERICFTGFQPDPASYLASTDIFVLASVREPFGLVLAEAREAGCAIVASNVDGIPEALDNGEAGILVAPGDSAMLAEAILTLLRDKPERDRWQRAARSNLDWLTADRVHRETMAVYRELRSNSDRPGRGRAAGRRRNRPPR